jgi:hypothetical protein
MRKFAIKPEIFHSDGAVTALAGHSSEKVFVIIDPVISELGFVAIRSHQHTRIS